MNLPHIKRALLSVSDKTGIVELAKRLHDLQIEIISTGGTARVLRDAGIPHREVADLTGMAELFGGRVKTLHPQIHAGILGKRDEHAIEAKKHGIAWIDLVVVNFYPFTQQISREPALSFAEAVEYIDIGGPCMVRAAAKNHEWVGVIVDPTDYAMILTELTHNQLSKETRMLLAEKAFKHCYEYDYAVANYFAQKSSRQKAAPDLLHLQLMKHAELRYGENPHQEAYAYRFKSEESLLTATQFQGKPLSYNNILDAEAAWACLQEFDEAACVIVKHANPCGVAVGQTIEEAYQLAHAADAVSAFGGVVALNRPCHAVIAQMLQSVFVEVVLAPAYTHEALAVFANKPNVRVLLLPKAPAHPWEMKMITGGLLLQEKNHQMITGADLQIVTKLQPDDEDRAAMLFAWRVLKHVKSNGILIAKKNVTVGIGAGQVSRIDSVMIALQKAQHSLSDAILASDAFFPFRDSIDKLAKTGIRAIVQPGGSLRDAEVIAACNEHNIAMVFTGKRCFRH